MRPQVHVPAPWAGRVSRHVCVGGQSGHSTPRATKWTQAALGARPRQRGVGAHSWPNPAGRAPAPRPPLLPPAGCASLESRTLRTLAAQTRARGAVTSWGHQSSSRRPGAVTPYSWFFHSGSGPGRARSWGAGQAARAAAAALAGRRRPA